jgi:hypothetical protein
VVPLRRPSAYLLALLVSPLAVLVLVGWTRFELTRVLVEVELGPALGAEALAVLAVERLWTSFDVERGADNGTLGGFRSWLDEQGVTAGPPVEAPHGGPLDDSEGLIVVQRVDHETSIELTFGLASTGDLEPDELTPLGTWAVTRRTWAGSGHVLLARDVGCALCHVTVRPLPRAARAAEPVRVAVLGDLVLRGDTRVDVHGTLHLGGALVGSDSDTLAPQSCAQLRFAALDGDLRLAAEAPSTSDLAPLAAMDLVRLRASEGLLLGRYPGSPRVLRRTLPERFPGFDDVRPAPPAGGSLHSARAEAMRGLGGGRGGVVQHGALLAELDAGAPLTPTSLVRGHLWAVGTSSAPLRIDGHVEVEGDLVMGGVVQGRGSLRARGMVVVVGSLRVAGQLALVSGTDLLAGAPFEAGALAPFVQGALRAPLDLPSWITPERLGRMGDRAAGPLALEAFCYAPRHVIVVAPSGATSRAPRGDVHVRGGLVAEVVAVHAPGELVLEDDPDTRALLALRAPLGLELRGLAPQGHEHEARARPHHGR